MVRVMGGTLRHAASSIFVTSFTTAAAFFTNYITKLPSVQLFGIFTGICILIYFCMVITMVAAFVITYEKYIQPYRCKVKTNVTTRLEKYFDDVMLTAGLLNNLIIGKKLPAFLIKARLVLFFIFFTLGVCGMLIVFYKPKLKPPTSWRSVFRRDFIFINIELC
jgi:predicted RND superfamily exporter protein